MKDLSNKTVTATNADFENYTYTQVYASGSGATPTINGTLVTMAGGSSIEILVKSISATPNVYLLGQKRLVVPEVIGKGPTRPFIITVKTDNAGTSATNQFTIPTNPSYRGVYDVETSDGQVYKNINGDTTLTFPSAGTYDIKISGNFASIYFNDEGDKDKLLDIKQWGDVVWRSMVNSFYGCTNLTNVTAKDVPVLSSFKFETPNLDLNLIQPQAVDLYQTFRDCAGLTNINFMANWDMFQVRVMYNLFRGCTSISDWSALENWDMSNIKYFSQVFILNSAFNNTAMSYISDWDTSNFVIVANTFAFTSITSLEPLRNWDVSNLTNIQGLFYGVSGITTLEPLSNWKTKNLKNLFATFRQITSLTSLEGLENWDVSNVTNMEQIFYSSTITSLEPLRNWNTGNVRNLGFAFRQTNITSLVGLENWDVSNVTNMNQTFYLTSITSLEPLRNWNTGNVKDLSFTFSRTQITETEPIENWDVGNATTLVQIFWQSASLTNSNLSKWNVGNVTNMVGMFSTDLVNLVEVNINGWDTSNVTNMGGIFQGAINLSNIIGIENLDTSNVSSFWNMFQNCDSFDQSLGNWDVSGALDLRTIMANTPGLSTANYDDTLIGWEASLQAKYPDGEGYPVSALRTPSFGGSIYTLGGAAEAARQSLIDNYAWAITDGGGV